MLEDKLLEEILKEDETILSNKLRESYNQLYSFERQIESDKKEHEKKEEIIRNHFHGFAKITLLTNKMGYFFDKRVDYAELKDIKKDIYTLIKKSDVYKKEVENEIEINYSTFSASNVFRSFGSAPGVMICPYGSGADISVGSIAETKDEIKKRVVENIYDKLYEQLKKV